MKNTAIIISFILVGAVAWIIFGMPHASTFQDTVELDTSFAELSMDAVPSASPTTTSAVKKTSSAPISTTVSNPKPPVPSSSVAPTDTTKYYTSNEVSAHATTESCWSSINGKVYDLTSWISRHPGGSSAIKRLCGVDGSEDFNEQHGGRSRPERELATFFIGVLR